jgi:hypothetical protein
VNHFRKVKAERQKEIEQGLLGFIDHEQCGGREEKGF